MKSISMSQQYNEKLYHGTISEIDKVDVSKGRGNEQSENLGMQYYVGKQEVADNLIKEIRLVDWR